MSTLSEEPAGLGPSRRYIDLARLGRTDWRCGLGGLGRIVIYSVAGLIAGFIGSGLVIVIVIAVRPVLGSGAYLGTLAPVAMTVAAAGMTWMMIKGVQHAVTLSQQRPLWSLYGNVNGLSVPRIAIGLGIALIGEAAILQGSAWISGDNVGWFDWPASEMATLSCLANLALVLIQASGEELIFRGWLTQSLGQVVRSRFALTLIIALLFALSHGFSHGIFTLPYFMIASLEFSALSLRDGRLELAIGAHIAHNWLSVLSPPPGENPSLTAGLNEPIDGVDLATSLLVLLLVCGLVELLRRYRWLSSSAT